MGPGKPAKRGSGSGDRKDAGRTIKPHYGASHGGGRVEPSHEQRAAKKDRSRK